MPAIGKSKKSPGKIRSAIGKVRKKFLPTFGEQFTKAKKEGKKTFRSTRDDTKKGKLSWQAGDMKASTFNEIKSSIPVKSEMPFSYKARPKLVIVSIFLVKI